MTNDHFIKYDAIQSAIYSARAECQQDADLVVNRLQAELPHITFVSCIEPLDRERGLPDVTLQLEFTQPLNFGWVLRTVNELEDCHVILQTLAPCALKDNKCERDHSR